MTAQSEAAGQQGASAAAEEAQATADTGARCEPEEHVSDVPDEDTVDESAALQKGIEALDEDLEIETAVTGRRPRKRPPPRIREAQAALRDGSSFAHGGVELDKPIPAPAMSSREDPPGELRIKSVPASRTRNQKKKDAKNRLPEQHEANAETTQPEHQTRGSGLKLLLPSVRLVRDTGKSPGNGGHLGLLGRTTNGGWSREIRLAGTIFSNV